MNFQDKAPKKHEQNLVANTVISNIFFSIPLPESHIKFNNTLVQRILQILSGLIVNQKFIHTYSEMNSHGGSLQCKIVAYIQDKNINKTFFVM